MTVAIAIIAARIDIEISEDKIKIDTPPTKFTLSHLNPHLLKTLDTVRTVRIVHGNINNPLNNTNVIMILANNNKGNINKIGTETWQKLTTRKMPTSNVTAHIVEIENNLITNKVKTALNIGIGLIAETEMSLTTDSEVKTEQAGPR
jgi:hypothetical protein